MPKLTSAQARELSRYFLGMAQATGDYRFEHWDRLTHGQRAKLGNFHTSLLRKGEDILALSTTLVLDEVETSLTNISTITMEIREDYRNLASIQDAIGLATSMVTFGASVISRNPESIGKAFTDLKKSWDKLKEA